MKKEITIKPLNYLQEKLWNLKGYDKKYLLSLNEKEVRGLYDTEFYYSED